MQTILTCFSFQQMCQEVPWLLAAERYLTRPLADDNMCFQVMARGNPGYPAGGSFYSPLLTPSRCNLNRLRAANTDKRLVSSRLARQPGPIPVTTPSGPSMAI